MGYNYSLNIGSFTAEDNEECLVAMQEAAPDLGEEMGIVDDMIVFEPDDNYSKWQGEEEALLPVISQHIRADDTCAITWDGEDGSSGGLVGRA